MLLHARLLLHVPTSSPGTRNIKMPSFLALSLLPSPPLRPQWTWISTVCLWIRTRLPHARLESREPSEIEKAGQIFTFAPLAARAVGHITDVHQRRTQKRDQGRRHLCYTRHWAGLAEQGYHDGRKAMRTASHTSMASRVETQFLEWRWWYSGIHFDRNDVAFLSPIPFLVCFIFLFNRKSRYHQSNSHQWSILETWDFIFTSKDV